MTICIAAICSWTPGQLMVVGASDRMLTAGDIQFEPPQAKIYYFTPSVVGLVAGDTPAQISICDAARLRITNPSTITVQEVANIFGEEFAAYRRKQAEARYLYPLGLDARSFLDEQHKLAPDLIERLSGQMQGCEVDAETIITGNDHLGSHLFVVLDPGVVHCNDSVAFAAIGSGQWHSSSQFMLAQYTREWDFPRALLLTYAAKKRAEVAPGIGRETDLFFVGDKGFSRIHERLHDELGTIFQSMDDGLRVVVGNANDRMKVAVATVIAQNVEQPSPGAADHAAAGLTDGATDEG